MKWLQRISTHLTVTLSIDKDDFEIVPVLLDPGGWKAANRAFGGQLDTMLRELNQAIAA